MDAKLKNQQEFYNETWSKGLKSGMENRGNLQTNLEFLEKTDLLRPNHRILEIGCGTGTLVSALSKQGYDVVGTDISTEAIAYGQAKYPGISLLVQAAETLQFPDETFDIVLSFDLFEHIEQIERHVTEVVRVLRPGGYYLLQTPNKYSNALFATLVNRSLKWRRAHPSLHSPRQLRRRLSRNQFDVRFVKMNPVNEFTIQKMQQFGRLMGALFKQINFCRLPLVLQTNLYVVARKT